MYHSTSTNTALISLFQTPSRYIFGYRVIDREAGSDFGHEESRQGRMTSGRYHVLLPDGRIQSVVYFVDQDGYHADVSYSKLRDASMTRSL